MEQKLIQLRDYQKEYEENNESFNISGFIREKLDEEIIPQEQIPAEYRPESPPDR
jgi:flagellar biosynthesis chaperone FliJ